MSKQLTCVGTNMTKPTVTLDIRPSSMGNGQDVRFLKLELQAPASGDDESELKIDAKKCTKNIGDLRIEIKSLDIRIISERKARKETSDKWFNSPDLLLYMSVSVLLGILLALSLHVIAYR